MAQFVLIGGGHASATAARTLRRLGFDGSIVLVGDEIHAPYQRPPLSKDHLTDEPDMDDIWSVSSEWCSENGVDLRTSARATRIDVETRAVTLDDGTVLPADAVLIATGVRPRMLPGTPSSRVLYLKTIDDAARVRAAMTPGARVVVVGGGFIGLEVAAAARAKDIDVTVIEAAAVPLAHILGEQVGQAVADVHRAEGVVLRTGVTVAAIEEDETALRVVTSDGATLPADLVVVGIGTVPNDEIARESEITVGNGIRIDQFCRTSAPGVFAAGDVANHFHPALNRRLRVEHFDNAARQAMVAARNMMGERVEYNDVHWFWSDQYDLNLQFAGHAADWDRIVVRGSISDRDFSAFYMKGDRVVAVFAMDRGGDVMVAKTLIAEGKPIADAVLASDDVDLEEAAFGAEPDAEDEADDDVSADPDEGFERVGRSGQVGEGLVRRFVVGETEIAVARSGGRLYALHNICTHLACRLTAGKVEQNGLTCLCHGSIFELATGIPINPPATLPVRTFPVMERDGQIFVKAG
jgi:3-phenylpropionate/trans-cinnamate dioxygenase ferredoxin reductase component